MGMFGRFGEKPKNEKGNKGKQESNEQQEGKALIHWSKKWAHVLRAAGISPKKDRALVLKLAEILQTENYDTSISYGKGEEKQEFENVFTFMNFLEEKSGGTDNTMALEYMQEERKRISPETPEEEKPKRGFFERITRSSCNRAAIVALAVTSLFPGNKVSKSVGPDINSKSAQQSSEVVTKPDQSFSEYYKNAHKKDAKVSERSKESSRETDVDIKTTFFVEDENGNHKFNPFSLIAPIRVDISREKANEAAAEIDVPHNYSRNFEASAAMNEKDHETFKEYVEQKLKQRFVSNLYGLDIHRGVYGKKEISSSGAEIESINITGFASPEGHQAKGASTIEQGNIDPENIELASKRAGVAGSMVEDQLREFGVDVENLNINYDVQELQFSDSELGDLAEMAQSYHGADDIEKIFNMISAYNDGSITDPETIKSLEEIVASKRGVNIEFVYKDEASTAVTIPIPLFLLLLGLPLLKRKRKDEDGEPGDPLLIIIPEPDPKDPPTEEPLIEETPKDPPTEEPPTEETPEPENIPEEPPKIIIPKIIEKTPLPEKDTDVYIEMERRTVVDDLNVYFDDKVTIERGLSYGRIVEDIEKNVEAFESIGQLENYMTLEILRAWKKHDIACRQEAGIDDLESGLDYENDEHQIRWAKMHAKALTHALAIKRAHAKKGREISIARIISYKAELLIKTQAIIESA